MLTITIPSIEGWDEETSEFVDVEPSVTIRLEHSLLSLSEWESRWCKPLLTDQEKTEEELLDYIRCMALDKDLNPEVFNRLSPENVKEIYAYIYAPMTATTFRNDNTKKSGAKETITSELVYYWMVALQIPFECQRWHLNRLITLIRVCEVKNQPPKKMSKNDIMRRNAELNAARRQKFNSKG